MFATMYMHLCTSVDNSSITVCYIAVKKIIYLLWINALNYRFCIIVLCNDTSTKFFVGTYGQPSDNDVV